MSKCIPIVLFVIITSSSIAYYILTQSYAKRISRQGLAGWQEIERKSNVQKSRSGAGSFRPVVAIRELERQTGNGLQSKNRTVKFQSIDGKVNLI